MCCRFTPILDLDPFGILVNQTTSRSVGGDPAEVTIFWGDERIDSNSTITNPDDNSSWDYKVVLSQFADIGTLESTISEILRRTGYITSCIC